MIKTLGDVLRTAAQSRPLVMAVAAAQDEAVLTAVHLAAEHGLVKPLLVGDKTGIIHIAQKAGIELELGDVIDVPDKESACMKAAELVRDKKADVLMKGMVDTGLIMRAVLDKENNLRKSPVISQKAAILKNAVEVAHALENEMPRAAVLCAVEKVNPKMPCTLDAKELARQNKQGDIPGCLVDGPLALDNAVSIEAAKHKGVDSPVAGRADILLVPDIEAGNMLNKAMEYFAGADKAGVMMGAKVPIILTSRAASPQSKLYSIALGVLIASKTKELF